MPENEPPDVQADHDWFCRLFDECWADVHRYAQRRVGRAAADDVAEEVFLVAWRRRDSSRRVDTLPWLYRTAAFVIANQRRAGARAVDLNARIGRERTVPLGDPAEAVPERNSLLESLESLPEADRELLMLVGWEELSASEAAAVIGCSVTVLRMRLHRARRRFRRALEVADSPMPGSVVVREVGNVS